MRPSSPRSARSGAAERRQSGAADYGYDHGLERTFHGFRAHPRAGPAGVTRASERAPARASGEARLPELAGPPGTTGIGDRGYHSPAPAAEPAAAGVLTPYRHAGKGPGPARAAARSAIRYRPGTVDGQPADRYHGKRTRAKDRWHPQSRVTRKVLSHTAVARLTRRHGHHTPSFDNLQLAA